MSTAEHGRPISKAPSFGRFSAALAEPGSVGAACLASLAVLLLWALTLTPIGPLTHHMAVHIVLMGAAAPALALVVSASITRIPSGRSLALATAAQIVLLWGWHAPPALDAALTSPALHLAMVLSTTGVAVWFWSAVIGAQDRRGWQAIAALAITAKLFCLPAAILVFAARPLYACNASPMCGGAIPPLDDQHLAGLLMLTACPLTYLTAAVILTARWLRALRSVESGSTSMTVRAAEV